MESRRDQAGARVFQGSGPRVQFRGRGWEGLMGFILGVMVGVALIIFLIIWGIISLVT